MIDGINFLLSVAGKTDSPSFGIQHDAFVLRFSANLPLIIVHLEDAAPGSNRSTAIKRSSGEPRTHLRDISDARKEHDTSDSRNFALTDSSPPKKKRTPETHHQSSLFSASLRRIISREVIQLSKRVIISRTFLTVGALIVCFPIASTVSSLKSPIQPRT